MLRLAAPARQALEAHAAKGYPSEVCGILLGRGEQISEAQPAANLNTERAHDRYQLDPQDQLRIEKDARARGLEVLGYYHSHPDHPAQPSATDLELSWEGVHYLIIAVAGAQVQALRAWRRLGQAFEEVPLA